MLTSGPSHPQHRGKHGDTSPGRGQDKVRVPRAPGHARDEVFAPRAGHLSAGGQVGVEDEVFAPTAGHLSAGGRVSVEEVELPAGWLQQQRSLSLVVGGDEHCIR